MNTKEEMPKNDYVSLFVKNNRLKVLILNYFDEPIGDLPLRPTMSKDKLKKRIIEICKK